MTVNLEVKGTLAKLLATEDLIVEHKSVETASFNVQTRVLTLPRWDKASNNVADLLVAHEVGHALFTPNVDWREMVSCPHMFVNVTEDARIETLMKRKFAGLPKTFYRGYGELHDQDFFEVGDTDLDSLGIADRVNLHFKVGNFLLIQFNAEEQAVVDQIGSAETFEDALAAAEALYALHKKQQEEQEQETIDKLSNAEGENGSSDEDGDDAEEESDNDAEGNSDSSEQGTSQSEQSGDDKEEGEGDSDESDEQNDSDNRGSKGGTRGNPDSVRTMEALESKLGDLTNVSAYDEPVYIDYPKPRKDIVVPTSEIYEYLHGVWDTHYNRVKNDQGEDVANTWYERNIGVYQKKFLEFKREVQSEVNYMVKEFECKKSATAYARATTSRTGVLDCARLHTYKYNDDLFKKVTSLPEGKNHGLIFTLDWSGSMCEIIEDTVKQLLSLVMFCDKVNIPFKVYAFSNEWNNDDSHDHYMRRPKDDYSQGNVFHIPSYFNMMTMLSSGVSRKVLYRQMADLYSLACMFRYDMGSGVPSRLMLSGTPLNEALISLRQILPAFQAEANVEKAHVIVLTDGEAGGSIYTCVREHIDNLGKTVSTVTPRRMAWGTHNVYLRNRKTGTTKLLEKVTQNIIEDLRTEFPNSSFTGFRISERGNTTWVRSACGYDQDLLSAWKKDKCVTLLNQGYNKYYVMAASKLQEDSEFEVAEDASKAKIKSAFAKSLKNKKSNKRILADFIGEIA